MKFLFCTLVAALTLTSSIAFAKSTRKPNAVSYDAPALVICREGKSLSEVQGMLNHALAEGTVASNRVSAIGAQDAASMRVGSVSAPSIVIDGNDYTLCVTVTRR